MSFSLLIVLVTYLWCLWVISLHILLVWSCSLVDMLNATLCIASYLCLNVTRGSCADIRMFCNLVAASVVLGMSK